MLSRDDILAVEDLSRQKVKVPEWGGEVYVRELTALEGAKYDAWMYGNKDDKVALASGFNSVIVMLSACDESGARLFTDDDLESIQGKNPSAINRIAEAALRLNKMREEDFEAEVKNSESEQTDVSTSASAA
jgi:hypothetical protein